MNTLLETALLHTFIVVADTGSFTRAAERLHLSQSAVSAQIARLEAQAGHALLARNTRTVKLTREGGLLLSYARAMLALNDEARACLHGMALHGELRVGASEDFASSWLPYALQRFAQHHRALRLELRVDLPDNLFRLLDAGELDVAVGSRCHGTARGLSLGREPLVWAFSRHAPAPAGALPMACFPDPCPYRDAALAALARAGRPADIVCVSPSLAGVKAAARAGLGVTPLPRSALGDALRELGRADGLPRLPAVEFLVAHHPASPGAAELAQALHDEARARSG